jgi:hypothetical protein
VRSCSGSSRMARRPRRLPSSVLSLSSSMSAARDRALGPGWIPRAEPAVSATSVGSTASNAASASALV